MCGLFGIAGAGISLEDLKALQSLTLFSVLRGEDSTGFFKAGYNGKSQQILKDTLPSPTFLLRHKDFIDDYQTYFMMGHVRDSTVGGITKKNAHPFMYSDIVGAHNGTLYDSKYRPVGSKRSDSDLLFQEMNTRGVPEVLSELDGDSAFAVSVYHRKDYAFTLARSKHRPLHVAIHQHRGTFYWASEFEMLEFILARHNLDVKIYELVEYRSYHIDIQDIKAGNNNPWTVSEITQNKSTLKKRTVSRVNYGPQYASYTSHMAGEDWDEVPFDSALDKPEDKEECILCGRGMTAIDIVDPKTTALEVDGVNYYTCPTCTEIEGRT